MSQMIKIPQHVQRAHPSEVQTEHLQLHKLRQRIDAPQVVAVEIENS